MLAFHRSPSLQICCSLFHEAGASYLLDLDAVRDQALQLVAVSHNENSTDAGEHKFSEGSDDCFAAFVVEIIKWFIE